MSFINLISRLTKYLSILSFSLISRLTKKLNILLLSLTPWLTKNSHSEGCHDSRARTSSQRDRTSYRTHFLPGWSHDSINIKQICRHSPPLLPSRHRPISETQYSILFGMLREHTPTHTHFPLYFLSPPMDSGVLVTVGVLYKNVVYT